MPSQSHRIESRPAFHVAGLRARFTPPDVSGIPDLWHRFIERIGSVTDRVGKETYGVCVCAPGDGRPEAPGPRPFDYTACVQVTSPDAPPEGLVGFTVPAGTYAVFTHRGPIGRFHETIRRIWGEWIPAAGLRPTGAPDFELYDARFRGEEPESELEVWVPVEPPR